MRETQNDILRFSSIILVASYRVVMSANLNFSAISVFTLQIFSSSFYIDTITNRNVVNWCLNTSFHYHNSYIRLKCNKMFNTPCAGKLFIWFWKQLLIETLLLHVLIVLFSNLLTQIFQQTWTRSAFAVNSNFLSGSLSFYLLLFYYFKYLFTNYIRDR